MTAERVWALKLGLQCYAAKAERARICSFFFRVGRFCFFRARFSSRSRALDLTLRLRAQKREKRRAQNSEGVAPDLLVLLRLRIK
jgi:hypothetical protein